MKSTYEQEERKTLYAQVMHAHIYTLSATYRSIPINTKRKQTECFDRADKVFGGTRDMYEWWFPPSLHHQLYSCQTLHYFPVSTKHFVHNKVPYMLPSNIIPRPFLEICPCYTPY